MLDAETKRRIDTARDLLVGKVPDPKSQVEQITIALIYKFMDDIDAQSEELGGERSFFAGEFARYGWSNLMDPRLGGHETLDLYAEAIVRMPQNPGIPSLFRDIFNNAFLPYRDPETLREFLRVIDEFTYDNSERLGDAFEYLLSVLDSQGDAGQFRTPRHIIDFIVAVVDPKKEDAILDPACGTAGFLISSYKHILAATAGDDGRSALTPDDLEKLADNFTGYDISPDMVRLSLVNLYLHEFADPHIHEYDTLTSQDRWNEYADVILANPPFMSPKGGIRPHNRFSVKAKRSEVLFVDYMAEHLKPNGRAGIIVPEGIIFQSQTAYKQLRKMLVEEYLVAVVSLPSGVFQPYSGVKTSVLILDRELAKRADSIGFFKVENDGFDLGAQRRPIDRNDLPRVRDEIGEYLRRLRVGESVEDFQPEFGLVVKKDRVAEDGEYNLSGEQYRESVVTSTTWPMKTIGEVCQVNPESVDPKELYSGSYFNYIDISCVENESGRFLGPNEVESANSPSRARRLVAHGDILVSTVRPNLRAFTILTNLPERAVASTGFAVLRSRAQLLLPEFLILLIRDAHSVHQMVSMMGKGSYPSINQKDVESVQIPLPSLEVQREIVAEIEGYQKVIDGARAVVENYRPHIVVDPEWPMVALGEVCKVKGGKRLPKGAQYSPVPTNHRYIRVADFWGRSVNVDGVQFISDEIHEQIRRYTISSSDVYVSIAGTIGLMGVIPDQLDGANLTENAAKLTIDDRKLDKGFLSAIGNGDYVQNQIRGLTHAVGVPKLALQRIETVTIPLPPLDVQRGIVTQIEEEEGIVEANRELIERFEKKIEVAVGRVWGNGVSEL